MKLREIELEINDKDINDIKHGWKKNWIIGHIEIGLILSKQKHLSKREVTK